MATAHLTSLAEIRRRIPLMTKREFFRSARSFPIKGFVFRDSVIGATALLIALTVMVTWPQALHLNTMVVAHDDTLLSMWRLGWIAHALKADPGHLFDGNIFYPNVHTLAYSDATLLEGLIAAPWLWAGTNPVLVYNLLLLGGIVSSGIGMFVLVRHLTNNPDAALVSAVIFTIAPYRIEHVMHLELQWTVWMPLTLLAIHRLFEEGSMRWGIAAGMLLSLQLLSSVYYGAFLGMITAVFIVLLAASQPSRVRNAVGPLCIAAIVPAIVALAYARPYVEVARLFGTRAAGEIATFSASVPSYITAPTQNWIWGGTGSSVEGNERHLFPGLVAVALAAMAFAKRPRRLFAWIYLGVGIVAFEFSLGMNGAVYRWLHDHVWALGGFRAPARFGVLVVCALAVLAGFGFEQLQRLISRRSALIVSVLAALALECGAGPLPMDTVPTQLPDVYKFLKSRNQAVVVELPIDDGYLTRMFMYWSAQHLSRLVNGYSGMIPRDYELTLTRMSRFPNAAAIARLRELEVRYILVHESFIQEQQRLGLILELARRPELLPHGKFRSWVGTTLVFELKPADQESSSSQNDKRSNVQ
ncbi:MAG: hypothetical protein C5B57_10085 [Blastocatellia bacterium]|nr:MAG: hypothetical protein C5B57_10085 [Blastocatellia bacterium]